MPGEILKPDALVYTTQSTTASSPMQLPSSDRLNTSNMWVRYLYQRRHGNGAGNPGTPSPGDAAASPPAPRAHSSASSASLTDSPAASPPGVLELHVRPSALIVDNPLTDADNSGRRFRSRLELRRLVSARDLNVIDLPTNETASVARAELPDDDWTAPTRVRPMESAFERMLRRISADQQREAVASGGEQPLRQPPSLATAAVRSIGDQLSMDMRSAATNSAAPSGSGSVTMATPAASAGVDSPPATVASGAASSVAADASGSGQPQPKKSRLLAAADTDNRASLPPTPAARRSGAPKSVSAGARDDADAPPSVVVPSSRLSDVGGACAAVSELCRILLHLSQPALYEAVGAQPPRGVLLHGPTGTGKTLLGKAVAGELGLPLVYVSGAEIIGAMSGQSERRLRDHFLLAASHQPAVLFIDEVDCIVPKRDAASKDMERRVVSQLVACFDRLAADNSRVLVIAATNRLDAIDTALRRAGRFDRELALGYPDRAARRDILRIVAGRFRLADDVCLEQVAELTPGFVGADIEALLNEAAVQAVNRRLGQSAPATLVERLAAADAPPSQSMADALALLRRFSMPDAQSTDQLTDGLRIEMTDLRQALNSVKPAATREGFATVPDVTWADVGALSAVRRELQLSILAPIRHWADFERLGLPSSAGVLLAGPPGCGKTLLAKAIANESGLNFISVRGPELLNMYVGESERAVRGVFERARNSAPCVIFFDEMDALCPRRAGVGRSSGDSGAAVRVVNQMLTEMDGVQGGRREVFILAATNRPDMLDPALLRPGRLDKQLFVGLPDQPARVDILTALTRNRTRPPLADDVDLDRIASAAARFTGADLGALVREAAMSALQDKLDQRSVDNQHSTGRLDDVVLVEQQHFQCALAKILPSVSEADELIYERMKCSLGAK